MVIRIVRQGRRPGKARQGLAKLRSCGLRKVLFGFAIPWCASMYLAALPARAQTPQTMAPEGYVDLDGLWDSPASIRVCWEAAGEPYAQEKGWVKDAVLTHISDVSSVRFRDWNA